MAKQHKIKRYNKRDSGTYKAKPHPVTIILLFLLAGGMVALGVIIYEPVSEFILGMGKKTERPSISLPEQGSSEQEPASEPEQSSPEPVRQPLNTLRALELPLETAKNPANLSAWLDAMPESVNSVMVRLKGSNGVVQYDSSNASLSQWAAVLKSATIEENPLDLAALSETLRERNLGLVVWMSAFRDPVAARGDRDRSAVLHVAGSLWLDNAADAGGQPWLNPYSSSARAYLTSLVSEVTALGADLVVFDNVLFPNDPTNGANWGDTGGLSRSQILSLFLKEAGAVAEANGAKVIPYFAKQQAENIASALDDSLQYGGEPANLTDGPVLIMLSISDSTAGLSDILKSLPESLSGRLSFVIENNIPTKSEIETLEGFGAHEFICLTP